MAIPDSALAREATEFVRDASTQLLFDHSRRVFLWASMRAQQLSLDYDAELLYVGAMFHDVGLLEGHRSADERFVDGANAARAFLERHGLPEEQVMTVSDRDRQEQSSLPRPARCTNASPAGCSLLAERRRSVVVQAVAGSSPVAHLQQVPANALVAR